MKYRIKCIPTRKGIYDWYLPQYKKFGIWWSIGGYCISEQDARNVINQHKNPSKPCIIEVE